MSDVLQKALAMFEEAGRHPKLTAAQVHALLFVACESSIERQSNRLPTISCIAKGVNFSPSGASRLMGSLLKEGLVISDRGITGRSEAFVLSERGAERVTRVLEAMTEMPVTDLNFHTFWTYAQKRYAGI